MNETENPTSDLDSIEENNENHAQERKSRSKDSWEDLEMIPNRKRFLILSIIISVLELGGFFIFAYAITVEGGDLKDLGLFLLPPFMGAFISYFVENKKEATGISAINAITSIIPFTIIYLLLEKFVFHPEEAILIYDYLIPGLAIILQIAIGYTLARMRSLYRVYGDSSIPQESDEAMIAELEANKQEKESEEEKQIEISENKNHQN